MIQRKVHHKQEHSGVSSNTGTWSTWRNRSKGLVYSASDSGILNPLLFLRLLYLGRNSASSLIFLTVCFVANRQFCYLIRLYYFNRSAVEFYRWCSHLWVHEKREKANAKNLLQVFVQASFSKTHNVSKHSHHDYDICNWNWSNSNSDNLAMFMMEAFTKMSFLWTVFFRLHPVGIEHFDSSTQLLLSYAARLEWTQIASRSLH